MDITKDFVVTAKVEGLQRGCLSHHADTVLHLRPSDAVQCNGDKGHQEHLDSCKAGLPLSGIVALKLLRVAKHAGSAGLRMVLSLYMVYGIACGPRTTPSQTGFD